MLDLLEHRVARGVMVQILDSEDLKIAEYESRQACKRR